MNENFLLGIDLGTSSVKVGLFAANNFNVRVTNDQAYSVHYPQPGFAEQDPHEWWAAVVGAVRDVMRRVDVDRIGGIGIAGQMHGLVCLGKNQKVVHPALIWADTRAKAEVEQLAAFQTTCSATMPGPPAAGFAAASALWLSRHKPEVLPQTQTILCPKDYVRFRLTGQLATDPSDAAGTWLFDIAANGWAAEVVEFCGLRQEQMPVVRPSAAVCGSLTATAAQALGLKEGTPVVTGSADLPGQALGHAIVESDRILVTVGTGGQVFPADS